ncbi:MAG: glycosyltransferase family 39 protein, partial [bacterium]
MIILALVLRLIGIAHGFPYIYHPDEPTVVRSALGIRFNLNPGHFDWPHFYIYLNYFVYMIFAKLRTLLPISQFWAIIYNDELVFYLISRIFSALLGAFTIIPIYLWVKRVASKNAAVWSSAFLAVMPLHVRNSHYALIDVPMLFLLSWSLFCATFSPILSGLFLGLSASTKYNGILGAPFIIIFYLITRRKFADFAKTGIFTVLGFILGTPYALLDFKTFSRTDGPQGAFWQFTNVGKVDFTTQISQFVTTLAEKLPVNLGYGAALIFAVG